MIASQSCLSAQSLLLTPATQQHPMKYETLTSTSHWAPLLRREKSSLIMLITPATTVLDHSSSKFYEISLFF